MPPNEPRPGFFFDIPGMICMGPICGIYVFIVDILNRYNKHLWFWLAWLIYELMSS